MSYRHDTGPNPWGVGIEEQQLHVATGLRNRSLDVVVERAIAGVVATSNCIIGTADGSASTDWGTGKRAAAASWNPFMGVASTPLLSIWMVPPITSVAPHTCRVRVRLVGLDQFGNRIVETSPWLTKVIDGTHQTVLIAMSKVFSVVDDIFVMTSNVSNAGGAVGSGIAIGWGALVDPTGLEAAAITDHPIKAVWDVWYTIVSGGATTSTTIDTLGTAANWGVGLPFRVSPFGPDIPHPTPEIMGATGQLLRQITTPALLNEIARLPARGQGSVTTGVCIGRNASGWQGTPHKLGFFSNDSWATKVSGITLTGSSSRAGDLPLAYVQHLEDTLRLTAMLRTTLGTQRGDNATPSYPRG